MSTVRVQYWLLAGASRNARADKFRPTVGACARLGHGRVVGRPIALGQCVPAGGLVQSGSRSLPVRTGASLATPPRPQRRHAVGRSSVRVKLPATSASRQPPVRGEAPRRWSPSANPSRSQCTGTAASQSPQLDTERVARSMDLPLAGCAQSLQPRLASSPQASARAAVSAISFVRVRGWLVGGQTCCRDLHIPRTPASAARELRCATGAVWPMSQTWVHDCVS